MFMGFGGARLPEQVVPGEPGPENDESSEDRALEWERHDLKSSVCLKEESAFG